MRGLQRVLRDGQFRTFDRTATARWKSRSAQDIEVVCVLSFFDTACDNARVDTVFEEVSQVTTTINLSDEELADLKELTKQTDPQAAIRAAMQDYVRYARRMQLKQLSGHVRIQDNWQELEAAEMESQRDIGGPGAD
jgi:hypothetical protein